jgi:signal transduction histidine kinase
LIAGNPKTELAKGLDTIRANVKRMLTLVNQLLDLSRLDNGLLRLHIQRVELVSFLNYLSDSQQLLAKTRDISLQFQCDLQELYADFDVERLRQIIRQSPVNALKFTPGGGTVTISLDNRPTLSVCVSA